MKNRVVQILVSISFNYDWRKKQKTKTTNQASLETQTLRMRIACTLSEEHNQFHTKISCKGRYGWVPVLLNHSLLNRASEESSPTVEKKYFLELHFIHHSTKGEKEVYRILREVLCGHDLRVSMIQYILRIFQKCSKSSKRAMGCPTIAP